MAVSKRQWALIKEGLKFVGIAATYGLIFGTTLGVSALFFLHFIYGFSLAPCEFARGNCQVGSSMTALPIPHVNFSRKQDLMGVSPWSKPLFGSTIKASRER